MTSAGPLYWPSRKTPQGSTNGGTSASPDWISTDRSGLVTCTTCRTSTADFRPCRLAPSSPVGTSTQNAFSTGSVQRWKVRPGAAGATRRLSGKRREAFQHRGEGVAALRDMSLLGADAMAKNATVTLSAWMSDSLAARVNSPSRVCAATVVRSPSDLMVGCGHRALRRDLPGQQREQASRLAR